MNGTVPRAARRLTRRASNTTRPHFTYGLSGCAYMQNEALIHSYCQVN